MKKTAAVSILIVALFVASQAYAINAPEPQSGGKFIPSKGTKAARDYEQKKEGPNYTYGKGMEVGPVHLRPFASFNTTYDDNVFLEDTDPDHSLVYNLEAGSLAELPLGGGQHLLSAEYSADTEWFERFGDQDHTDHNLQGALELNFVPFTLLIQDTFRRTVDRSDTEFTNRIDRKENAIHSLLEVPFSQFFLETELYYYMLNFRHPENSIFDRNDATIYQRVGFDVAPSTQLLVEYGYTDISYNKIEGRDGNANQLSLGLRGQLSGRLTYQAWGGYESLVYDTDDRPDFYDAIFRAALQYDISEKSYIVLRGDRRPEESTYDNQNFYVRNRLDLSWRQQLAERLFMNSRGVVQFNEYSRITEVTNITPIQGITRRDTLYQAVLGLEYYLASDVTSLILEYKFNSRESNTPDLGYDGNTLTAGVRSKF